jgi:hypothetical protein
MAPVFGCPEAVVAGKWDQFVPGAALSGEPDLFNNRTDPFFRRQYRDLRDIPKASPINSQIHAPVESPPPSSRQKLQ